MQSLVLLAGRALLSAVFLVSGWEKVTAFTTTAAGMAHLGVPAARALLVVAILIEIGGGLMLLFGWWTRLMALVFFLYIIPVTLTFHRFWGVANPALAHANLVNFLKNLSIMGGMLFVAMTGPGGWSIDAAVAPRRPKLRPMRF